MKKKIAEKTLDSVVSQMKKLRKEQGLSHQTLAEMVGVTRPAISFIESGKHKPTLFVALKIANALEVSLADLIKKAEK